jgi:hypothetical protein
LIKEVGFLVGEEEEEEEDGSEKERRETTSIWRWAGLLMGFDVCSQFTKIILVHKIRLNSSIYYVILK